MSINLLKEFVIHYHTFRNVDLLNQGLYQIRTKIFYADKITKYFAVPYQYLDSKEIENSLQTDENAKFSIISNQINESNTEYHTKTFFIRYSDEEIEVDEFCYYRLEIPTEKLNTELFCVIEFSLYYSDSYINIKDKSSAIIGSVEFKCAGTQTILLNMQKTDCIESHTPIIYTDSFSSILNCSIHVVTLDYKLRMIGLSPFVVEEDLNPRPNGKISSNKKTIKTLKSILQFFLDEKDCQYRLGTKIIDELYYKYVVSLMKVYIVLRAKYTKLLNKIFDDKIKSEFPFFAIILPLAIYFEEKDKEIITLTNEETIYDLPENLIKLSNRIEDFTSDYISSRIITEINFISGQLAQLWYKYIEIIRYFPTESNFMFICDYNAKHKENLLFFVKRSVVNITDTTNLIIPVENNIGDINNAFAKEMRKSFATSFKSENIEISSNYIKPTSFPILFEEYYVRQVMNIDTKQSFYEKNNLDLNTLENDSTYEDTGENARLSKLSLHLIILVHGFQGNSYDMRMIKNTISLINPGCVLLPSSSNQDDTECDISEMGKKLANEVKNFLKDWNEGSIFKKISFIGHSIGGLIIRASLPHLSEYSDKMWMYMSLSSPHLGYMYSTSTLIDAGIWVLKTWKKSKSLEQLSLSDAKELKDTLIYKLSSFEGLNWFNYIYLVSSHQDHYAPYESTRIQLCSKALKDDYRADIYRTMAYNILSKIDRGNIRRIDVNFHIPEKNLDSFIGRTAHIQFLENIPLMNILFTSIENVIK